MVEDIFIDDLRLRGVEVIRSSPFNSYFAEDSRVLVECNDLNTGTTKTLKAKFLVGCDGAHSKVRKSMLGEMDGASGNSAWGVLDGKLPMHIPI
jgi:2-polyprenyl-6-methoxyphenol hydroxylase-like FAD-dependent oxidoreductase